MRVRFILSLFLTLLTATLASAQFPSVYEFGDELTGTDFTIAGWMNTSVAQSTDVALFSNKDWGSGGNPGFVVTVDTDDTFKANVNGEGGERADTDWAGFSQNTWNFVVATFDRDGDMLTYLNGVDVTDVDADGIDPMPTGSVDTFESPFFLNFNIGQDGTGNYAGGQGFQGLVDDVGIWQRVLSPTEINGLFSAGLSLGSLSGTSLDGGSNLIDDDLVGYYAFDNDFADGKNGNDAIQQGTVGFQGGQFGQAISLDGSSYVTIGDAAPPEPVNFTGNSATNNVASNGENWDVDPSSVSQIGTVNVANGTSESFSGANTGPATFNADFAGSTDPILNMVVGGEATSTFVNFDAPDAAIVGVGGNDTVIGAEGSNVTMVMNGGILNHTGASEEGSEMEIGQPGSTVNLAMNGSAELATGTRVADADYATGFRRPKESDGPDFNRNGDDIKLAEGNDGDAIEVNVEMNDDSVMYTPDVFYPGDSNNSTTNVVQNDNSQVIVNWDSRFLDDNGGNVNWEMNGNSKFLAARDHGLGETGDAGMVNLTINDNAEFRAGDRLVFGAGGGTVNVTLNDGMIKVGGDSPTDVLLVDDTGEPAPGEESEAIDWILHMGGGADATLNVKGGRVEVGRSAYIGRGGGTALAIVDGGVFEVKGVGKTGIGLGNGPGGGVPTDVNHVSPGGDVIIGNDSGDMGTLDFRKGELSIARDLVVSFDDNFDGEGGDAKLRISGDGAGEGGSSFTVGRDLSFSGDFFAASGGTSVFEASFNGSSITPVDVSGDLYIFNSGDSVSEFMITVAPGGTAPAIGEYVLINYDGSFGPGGLGDDMFTEIPSDVFTYELIYDENLGQVRIDITDVSLSVPCDFNLDGTCDGTDINALMAEVAAGTNNEGFDLNDDQLVNNDDRDEWLSLAGEENLGAGKEYLLGDANLDGFVDGLDFIEWNGSKFTSSTDWTAGNFNGDGFVDGLDFIEWNANKFTQSDGAAVPEPSSAALCGLMLLGLLRLRRAS